MTTHDPHRRAFLEMANRNFSLAIHGIFGVEVGIAMVLTGAPYQLEDWFGPEVRVWLGLAAAIPGFLLLLGALITETRVAGWVASLAGALGLCAWSFTMAVAYAAIAINQTPQIVGPHEDLPDTSGRVYIALLYQALFLLIGLHAITLSKLGRPPR